MGNVWTSGRVRRAVRVAGTALVLIGYDDGELCGAFGIVRLERGVWRISHHPTGMRLRDVATKTDARRLVRALLALPIEWDKVDERGLTKQPTEINKGLVDAFASVTTIYAPFSDRMPEHIEVTP